MRARLANPWGTPRVLRVVTILYVVWSLVPVLLAVRFAFNSGRSRTALQGWSFRWFWGDPDLSVFHDPTLQSALTHSLELAAIVMLISVPLGTASQTGSGGIGLPSRSFWTCSLVGSTAPYCLWLVPSNSAQPQRLSRFASASSSTPFGRSTRANSRTTNSWLG